MFNTRNLRFYVRDNLFHIEGTEDQIDQLQKVLAVAVANGRGATAILVGLPPIEVRIICGHPSDIRCNKCTPLDKI